MVCVFLSYAREDRDLAEQLATRLARAGLNVWWDRSLLAGDDIEHVIDTEIAAAHAVIVVWSQHAIASHWVKSEAATGLEHAKLIPVRIDDCRLPRPYDQVHTANLSGWNGGLTREVRGLIASAKAIASGKRPRARGLLATRKRRWVSLGALASSAMLALAVVGDISGVVDLVTGAPQPAQMAEQLETIDAKISTLSDSIAPALASDRQRFVGHAMRFLEDGNVSTVEVGLAALEHTDPLALAHTLEQSLRAREDRLSVPARAVALNQIGALLLEKDMPNARRIYDELLGLDPANPLATIATARLASLHGDTPTAKQNLTALLARTDIAPRTRHLTTNYLASVHAFDHEWETASQLMAPWLDAQPADTAPHLVSQSASHYAILMLYRGQARAAEDTARAFINLQQEEGFARDLSSMLYVLAETALDRGDVAAAMAYAEERVNIERVLMRQTGLSSALHFLARAQLANGAADAARRLLHESQSVAQSVPGNVMIYKNKIGLAEISRQSGDGAAACALVDQARAAYPSRRPPNPRMRQRIDALGCQPSADFIAKT